jgi:putative oxidoreductase
VTGLALLVPLTRRAAVGLIIVLLVVFTAMLAIAWARGLSLHCGCFGAGDGANTDFAIAVGRNLLLAVAACWIALRADRTTTRS